MQSSSCRLITMYKSNIHTWLACLLFASSSLFAQRIPGRYIVELTSEPVVDHVAPVSSQKPRSIAAMSQLRSGTAQSYRVRLQSEHQTMRRALEQRNAKVLGSTDTVANTIFVQV